MLADIWRVLATPTTGRTWYEWATIAMAHAVLGADLGALADTAGLAAVSAGLLRLSLGAVYWLIKERGDLRRGGTVADGLVDAGFVALGALYPGPAWWPWAVTAAVAAGVIFIRARGRDGVD